MRLAGRLKLGFYPLPEREAARLGACLDCPAAFSALDPCVGEGAAFSRLLEGKAALGYGVELDAFRAEAAAQRGIRTVHASLFDIRCAAESFSLLYLNPPYDFEAGESGNRRLERIFLEHCYRWLKIKGVLVFIIPRRQLEPCSRVLAEHFSDIRVYSLSERECVRFDQIAVMAVRRGQARAGDGVVFSAQAALQAISAGQPIPILGDEPDVRYFVLASAPASLSNQGMPLDEIEDLLPRSAAYRQAARLLVPEARVFRGRPLTPLHGGHVSLLATAGMLNGVFGEGKDRHMAHWRSLKFIDRWTESAPDGATLDHERERFSHELTLVYTDGRTRILTHEKEKDEL